MPLFGTRETVQAMTAASVTSLSPLRRNQPANFACPVPGCGSTFTRHFNLKGHMRSHAEEKPWQCKWPGCGKSFARQHDCKRHEQLHLNVRPYPCDACKKNFARMDALNRHLRSEGGSECLRRLESYLRCEGCTHNVTHTHTHKPEDSSFTEGRPAITQDLSPNSGDSASYAGIRLCEEYKEYCRSPGSFTAFAQAWNKLPLELSTYVLDYLESPEGSLDGTAQLALVSKAWSRIFRPRLFHRLELKTPKDVSELERILRSPVSAWLSGHITGVTFSRHSFAHPLSTTVVSMLPACTFIHALGRTDFRPHIQPTAALRHSLRTVTTFHLSHHRFLSLQHILRILASIQNLREVQFRDVAWSGAPLSTTEGANNICTGSFPHVRSIHMLSCTDNLVIPAWIFASTSTGRPFVRRTIEVPLPEETSAVINIVHDLLGDTRIDGARFRMAKSSADGYTFIGSLRARPMSEPPYTLRQTLAEVAVRSARDEAPGIGGGMWSIREIALAEGLHDIEPPTADYMGSRDWNAFASALLGLLQLERFHVLCGHARTKPEFADLQQAVARAIDPRLPINVQYNESRADARLLVPALFGISETDEGRYCVHESELPYDPSGY
ncbi:transcriptional regulator-like protein [Phanerochaete sordida]|uniref:Transcriptional regulator-like protein n=1 Tax=Phanerochaete sordida TaxID=48140 RepID=A0A9P3G637_9APHY|nr:transcriptional regulator-like protein [Phanerochaete sordida]